MYIDTPEVYAHSLHLLLILALVWTILYTLRMYSHKVRRELEKRNIVIYPLLLYAKTSRLNEFIVSIGTKISRLVKVISTISIIIGFFLMIIAIYFVHINIVNYFTVRREFSPVTPVIPGITIGPGVLPYFLLSATIAFIVHELAHAFTAVSEGVDIKSVGVAVFFAIPGAFIEPSEEQFEKASLLSKLRIVSMGSLANMVIFLITIIVTGYIFEPANAVVVIDTLRDYPAHGILKRGDLIISINSTRIYNVTCLHEVLSRSRPNNIIVLEIMRYGSIKQVKLKLAASPRNSSRGFMGVQLSNYMKARIFRLEDVLLSLELFNYLYWIALLNGSIAVINMLPMYISDGARIVQAIAEKFFEKSTVRKVVHAISIYSLMILIMNIILTYI